MKVLIVARYKAKLLLNIAPFIAEQAEALRKEGCEIDYFLVRGNYIMQLDALLKKIREFHPDIIHAHYGLCGLLANFQRTVPVVTTYHGSDIHSKRLVLFLSRISIALSAHNIFVSENLQQISRSNKCTSSVVPCGVDTELFVPMDKDKAREQLGWAKEAKVVLFAGSFSNPVKNAPLAKNAVARLQNITLEELSGFSREQVSLALNAADCMLMTSFREGSPQIVKEAMSCGCPIVSVDVGDVRESVNDVAGNYLCPSTEEDMADGLQKALNFSGRTSGRSKIFQVGLSNELVAKHVLSIYSSII